MTYHEMYFFDSFISTLKNLIMSHNLHFETCIKMLKEFIMKCNEIELFKRQNSEYVN